MLFELAIKFLFFQELAKERHFHLIPSCLYHLVSTLTIICNSVLNKSPSLSMRKKEGRLFTSSHIHKQSTLNSVYCQVYILIHSFIPKEGNYGYYCTSFLRRYALVTICYKLMVDNIHIHAIMSM